MRSITGLTVWALLSAAAGAGAIDPLWSGAGPSLAAAAAAAAAPLRAAPVSAHAFMRPYADPPGTHAPLGGAHAPLGGTAGVEACKTVIGGLGIDLDGATVFCPSNAAWLAFAEALGYKGHDPVLKMAFNMPIGALKAVVSYHIVPDAVLPASTFAALRGASLRTRAGAALTARRDPDGVVSLLAGGAAGAAEAGVTARDWTLGGGSYGPESRHVVHEVDAVLAPPGLQAELEAVRARNTAGSRRLRF